MNTQDAVRAVVERFVRNVTGCHVDASDVAAEVVDLMREEMLGPVTEEECGALLDAVNVDVPDRFQDYLRSSLGEVLGVIFDARRARLGESVSVP